jgi:hypothetical protein
MSMNTKSKVAVTLSILVGATISVGTLGGCETTKEVDRTQRKPHTAMRGPAYKRLILTYNEANNLAYRADRYAKAMRDSSSVDPDTQLRATELAENVAKFAKDIEWSLANTQRMAWHRSEMDLYWEEFRALYPDDSYFTFVYTTKDMRKATTKNTMKNQAEYAELHEPEKHDSNWGSLFKRPAEKVYDDQKAKQETN